MTPEELLAEQNHHCRSENVKLKEQVRVLDDRCNKLDLAELGWKRPERMMMLDRRSNECPECQHATAWHDETGRCLACVSVSRDVATGKLPPGVHSEACIPAPVKHPWWARLVGK